MPEILALSIVILIFSVIVHEVFHGLIALRFGDHTAERAGRLTLNPIPHIDPLGTILLPALLLLTGSSFFIAWAKPVPINPLNFSDIKKGELLTSFAGIAANLGLALFASVLYHILSSTYPQFLILSLLEFTVNINLLLAVFNLLPIPPLDGSKVVLSLLPLNLARKYQQIEPYGFFILMALLLIQIGNTSVIGLFLKFTTGILKSILGF